VLFAERRPPNVNNHYTLARRTVRAGILRLFHTMPSSLLTPPANAIRNLLRRWRMRAGDWIRRRLC
jgi:hypothetical protein